MKAIAILKSEHRSISAVLHALKELRRYADDGLVELQPDWIVVTPKGRLLVRAICMVFDRYLREARQRAGYSRII